VAIGGATTVTGNNLTVSGSAYFFSDSSAAVQTLKRQSGASSNSDYLQCRDENNTAEIVFTPGGSITATGTVMYSNGTDTSSQLTALGIVVARDTASAGKTVWRGFGGGTQTSTIYSDGSITAAGGRCKVSNDGVIDIQAVDNSANGSVLLRAGSANLTAGANAFVVKADGSATFAGSINSTATNQAFEVTASLITGGSFFRARNNVAASDKYFLYGDVDGVGPTVQLLTDGSAEFAGNVKSKSQVNIIRNDGLAALQIFSGTVLNAETNRITLSADGSATFASNVTVGINLRVNNNLAVYAAAGSIIEGYNTSSGSGVNTSMVTAEGNARFDGTVTANGSILTRAAGDLDVGDRLEKADNALQILKTAAAAASDFAALKAAIATALANI
jgi:hypothetical protein